VAFDQPAASDALTFQDSRTEELPHAGVVDIEQCGCLFHREQFHHPSLRLLSQVRERRRKVCESQPDQAWR
jgi:hypothetical protein